MIPTSHSLESDQRRYDQVIDRIRSIAISWAHRFNLGAMHKAGHSIESIAKVLNHSSPAVTMRYIRLVQEDTDERYTELEL